MGSGASMKSKDSGDDRVLPTILPTILPTFRRKSQEKITLLKSKNIDLPSKFKEFDRMNSGFIESAQLIKLAEWVLEVAETPSANRDDALLKIMARAG